MECAVSGIYLSILVIYSWCHSMPTSTMKVVVLEYFCISYPKELLLTRATLQKGLPSYNDDFPEYSNSIEGITEYERTRLQFHHKCNTRVRFLNEIDSLREPTLDVEIDSEDKFIIDNSFYKNELIENEDIKTSIEQTELVQNIARIENSFNENEHKLTKSENTFHNDESIENSNINADTEVTELAHKCTKNNFNENELIENNDINTCTEEVESEQKFTGIENTFNEHEDINSSSETETDFLCNYITVEKSCIELRTLAPPEVKRFLCEVCGFRTTHKTSLENHSRIHTGEQPFRCSFCEYRSPRKDSLARHTRTHTGEKPYRCIMCNFKSAHYNVLIQHFAIHSGEKPFSCKVCEYKTYKKINLKVHMRTHTGEKSFLCNLCDYKASHKVSLRNHISAHT